MEIDNLTVNIFLWEKTSKLFHHISSRQNPLHLSSCYCYGCRFWGPIAFQGFVEISIFEIQHEAKIIQNLFQNRLGNRSRNCFVGFRCFSTTSCSFHSAFICMHLPSCSFHLHACSFHFAFISFHVPFICIHVLSYYIPFMFIPMCIHFLSYSFHLHACSFHFALISLHVLSFPCISIWNWLYGLAR